MKNILDPSRHPNKFEHKENFVTFISFFIFYGVLGGVIGRLIDKSISSLKNENDSRLKLTSLFLLQIFINGVFFYIAFQSITFKTKTDSPLTLDDWISSTFQGLIFATTMYSTQNNLYENLKNGLF